MKRTCETCRLEYDDTYESTICPHDGFDMRCQVMAPCGATKLCTTVEEVEAFLAAHRPAWRKAPETTPETAPGAPGEDPAESLHRVQSGE